MIGIDLRYDKENFDKDDSTDSLETDEGMSRTEEVEFDSNAIRYFIHDMIENLMTYEDSFDYYRSILKIFRN